MSEVYGMPAGEWGRLSSDQRTAIHEAHGALADIGIEPTGFRTTGPTPPVWQPGDVVVVRFTPTSKPFTYVRGAHAWPGDRRSPKTDTEISGLFRIGKAIHVMRNGKLTDAGARMAADQLESRVATSDARGRLTFHSDTEYEAYLSGVVHARRVLQDIASEAGK